MNRFLDLLLSHRAVDKSKEVEEHREAAARVNQASEALLACLNKLSRHMKGEAITSKKDDRL